MCFHFCMFPPVSKTVLKFESYIILGEADELFSKAELYIMTHKHIPTDISKHVNI